MHATDFIKDLEREWQWNKHTQVKPDAEYPMQYFTSQEYTIS
jgi:hypothetical protein